MSSAELHFPANNFPLFEGGGRVRLLWSEQMKHMCWPFAAANSSQGNAAGKVFNLRLDAKVPRCQVAKPLHWRIEGELIRR